MIDFRYHLVSLISVFIALAIGIVLGAGPLRDTISDQLSGQVEVLRQEREDMRMEIDANRRTIDNSTAFIEASAPAILEGTLPGYRVALVSAPGVADDVVSSVETRLEESGAEITARVRLTDAWAEPDDADVREAVAQDVRSATDLAASAEDAEVLGAALAVALTGATVADPREASSDATKVVEAMTQGGDELLTVEGVAAPADLVLVLTTPREEPAPDSTPDPDRPAVDEAWATSLASVALGAPTVVAGYAAIDSDLLIAIRGERVVTTVDGLDTVAGQVTVPLALAAAAADEEARPYGFGIGAQQPLPQRQDLTGPPALEPPPEPSATDGETTDGEATDGEVTDGEATEGEATEGEATGGPTDGEATDGATDGESTDGESTGGESIDGEASP